MSTVLLYSGGMDSFILSALNHFDTALMFDLGTADNSRELDMVKKNPWLDGKLVIEKLPLHTWELENKILPFRNHIMGMIAANYGNRIIFGAAASDTVRDGDYVFKAQLEGVLNYFALESTKVRCQEYPYEVLLPLRSKTKTELVMDYLAEGNLAEMLWTHSRSCYAGNEKECGVCRSCMHKYVALVLNNIYQDGIFELDPAPFMQSFLEVYTGMNGYKPELENIRLTMAKRPVA